MDGFTRNPIHTLDALHSPLSRCYDQLSMFIVISAMHIHTEEQSHRQSKNNENIAPVTLLEYHNFTLEFSYFCPHRSRIATHKTFLNLLFREHTRLFIGHLFP